MPNRELVKKALRAIERPVDFEYFYFFTKNKKYYFKTQYELAKEESMERYKYQFKDSKRRESART